MATQLGRGIEVVYADETDRALALAIAEICRRAALAAEVGAPPWKVDRVRQQLRGWAPEGVAHALQVVAEADAQIKGEAASPDFALERAVRRIVACRS